MKNRVNPSCIVGCGFVYTSVENTHKHLSGSGDRLTLLEFKPPSPQGYVIL